MRSEAQKKLLHYAGRLLARRNYHSVTLREKLTQKEIGTLEDVETIINELTECKYINDSDYLRYYINDQLMLRPQGIRLVRQKLFKRGIKGSRVEQELEKHKPHEKELAQKAAEKKLRILKDLPEYERGQKLFRFLISRGFDIDTVKGVVKELNTELYKKQ